MASELTHEQVLAVLASPSSVDDLREYFTLFTGRRFEALGGGGDRLEIRDRVTAEDLVAVTTLGVSVPSEVSLALLEGDLGHELGSLLARIPATIELGSAAAADHLNRDGAPWAAWELLYALDHMGPTTTSKLLARKRPRLLPIYDEVVGCAVGRPPLAEWWAWYQRTFADASVIQSLVELRSAAALPPTGDAAGIGLPRVFDVIIWMRHHAAHAGAGRSCVGLDISDGTS